MRRRDFIGGLGAAVIWPVCAHAQQEKMKRVGLLMGLPESDPEFQARAKAFQNVLSEKGWIAGRNIQIDYRWGGDRQAMERGARELVALQPDVIFANAPPAVLTLRKIDQSIPTVFVAVTDPLVLGLVQSLPHPGGNTTGFTSAEVGLSGKWLELLKEVSPQVNHAAIVLPFGNPGGEAQFTAIKAVADPLGVTLARIGVSTPEEIERGLVSLMAFANGGLVVTRTTDTMAMRRQIIAVAAQYRLPAIYPERYCVAEGGLASYGASVIDDFRKAAGYVDRILKGEKAGDLPVQVPTKYELVINQKAAKALDLKIPQAVLATADEVIE